jgi:DNA-binding beta-propeller fold protein YncE
MKAGLLSLVACLVCFVAGLAEIPMSALGHGVASGDGVSVSSLLGGALVVAGSPVEPEEVQAQREALRFSSGAFAAREASETAYEHLDTAEAKVLARQVFPGLVNETAGGPPQLPAGARIVKMPAENVAQVLLAGGKHEVVESLEPIALETSPGHRAPIDLRPHAVGDTFELARPLVSLRIPKRLSEGVDLGGTGVSLTPVAANASPLSGSAGEVQGATVAYANTLTDGDTFVKATTFGFSAETLLRSVRSPRTLYFRVGMPAGARLVARRNDAGADVVDGGTTIATIAEPSARDAEGTSVPVSMSVLGDVLSVEVAQFAGRYRLPIVVDPTAGDPVFSNGYFNYKTEWHFVHTGGGFVAPEYPEGASWTEDISSGHSSGEAGGLFYTTRGESQIVRSKAEGHWNDSGSHIANFVVLDAPKEPYTEDYDYMPEVTESGGWGGYACAPELKCPETTVGTAPMENNNTAGYEQVATGSGEGHSGENTVTSASVTIEQKNGPELEFNKSSATIRNEAGEYVPNVLYAGHETWLSPHHGAFEVRAKDPGVGLSLYRVLTSGWGDEKYYYDEGGWCSGIQCPEFNDQGYIYGTGMPDGEDGFEALAEDYMGLYKQIYPQKIKIDATPPEDLKIVGLQNGNELPVGEPHLKVEATDGEGATKSSGVQSIKVSVEGQEVPGTAASCLEGPCTASTEFTLVSRDYTTGTHSMVVTATDNAGNVRQEEFTFRVHGASPVSMGPGSVDPSTGQFTLSASDVSLNGTSDVSRTYQSRELAAGAEGPLGPQWAISLGGGEGLTVLPTGSVIVGSSGGQYTTFVRNSKGELESPKGDTNLKLAYESEEHQYVLTDATAGTETVFEQPASTQSTPPFFGSAFGSEPGELQHPTSEALDSAGDLWVTDWTGDRVAKFSPTGALLAEYGSEGSGDGDLRSPFGIAINQKTGNVYVTDYWNNRIDELSSSGAFIRTMGWGVSNGDAEYQVCTSSCRAGVSGSGAGEIHAPNGIAIDSTGNLWVAEEGNERVQEFSEAGSYLTGFGSAGTGAGQFEAPMDIAFAGGSMYVTDQINDRVDEFSTGGTFIKTIGWGVSNGEGKLEVCTSSCKAGISGSGNGEFNEPRGLSTDPVSGDLYITEVGGNRVQELTSAGAFVTKFGSAGSGAGEFAEPMGVVVSSTGTIYVTDYSNGRVQDWVRSAWWPTSAKGALSVETTYSYEPVEGSTGATSMQPYEVLAPAPKGVSCGTKIEELKDGCRALTFKYATETTAKGENESEWGEYKGHLSQVVFHGYNPSSKAMEEKPVAQYSYDKQGRLRAEWDPRLEHPLKTTYGYDTEGHVTSLTPSGQESWAMIYGTIAGDSNTGRLLKATRAPASAALWNGEAVKDTEAPKLSGTAAVGVRMSVSNGAWSNSPVVYAYQWEDCNYEGKACTPIPGASNANYTPASSDVGHTLIAHVTATNGGGSVVASSASSALVVSKAGAYTQTADSGYSLNAVTCVPSTTDCVLSDSAGKALYATNVSTSSAATWKTWSGPSGQSPSQAVECPTSALCVLADGKETAGGKLYYATSLGGSWSEASNPTWGVDTVACASASFCVAGQDSGGDYRYSTSPASTSWTLESQEESGSMKSVFCLSSSFCAMADSKGKVHVATSTSQIESSTWKETDVDGSSALNGIACTSTTSCVAVDGSGNALKLTIESSGKATAAKHDIDGTTSLTAVACSGTTTCVAVDSAGNIFVSKNSGETWTKEYALGDKLTSVSCVSTSLCATVDTAGNVTAFNPAGGTGTNGELHSPQPGTTVEYAVPVSGTGAPYTLSKEEVEKWGQKDDPVEAAAVFPPDEPQGWPASDYKRATVHYWDTRGRTVNAAIPTGGIATSEYNESSEMTRALSAENRAAALKEGCKSVTKKECLSAEVSEKLDTKTEYNPEETNIVKVLGPEHKIKLAVGGEVEARAVSHDYYDEGAQAAEERFGEAYDLLTRETTGALLADGEEKETRTTTTSYNGQEDLGWKLRKATATTIDPAGLDLIQKTLYSPTTGDVIETRAPAGNAEVVYPPVFKREFGSAGSGSGDFNHPQGVAIVGDKLWVVDQDNNRIEQYQTTGGVQAEYGSAGTGDLDFSDPFAIAYDHATGNLYISDSGNNRIEVVTTGGKFVKAIGWGVSNGKEELETCETACKAGLAGPGNGEFDSPGGLAFDPAGDLWVTDTENNRVEEISPTDTYMSQFGSKGSGNGELSEPTGIAMDEGELYVVDYGNDRVEEFTPAGTYLSQFGSKGSGAGQFNYPVSIVANTTSGDLYVSDTGDSRIEEWTPAGKFLTEIGSYGTEAGELSYPTGVTLTTDDRLFIADQDNDRISQWAAQPEGGAHMSYANQFGSSGSGSGEFSYPVADAIDGHGNVWASDFDNNRIEEFSAAGKFIAAYGTHGSGHVQFSGPTGVAVNQSTGDVYVGDCSNHRVEELNEKGEYVTAFGSAGSEPGEMGCPHGVKVGPSGNVWVVDSEHNRIEEYSSTGTFIATYGKAGSGEEEFNDPDDLAFSGGNVYVTDTGNHRVEELSTTGEFLEEFGGEGSGDGKFEEPTGIAADAAGNLYVLDSSDARVQEFNAEGMFLARFASAGTGEGQLSEPAGIAINAAGSMYVVDSGNNRIEEWIAAAEAAHDTKTIYYTAAEEAEVAACRNHPEWAGLLCQTEPAAQPNRGLPELPVTTVGAYNIWDDAETTEEKFGTGAKAVTRTKTQTYDPAGRAETSEETTSPATDKALPKVTNEYNTTTGALDVQKATIGGKEKTLTSKENTLGQLVEYTDAEGNVAKYTYEEGGDGRLKEVNEGKGEEAKNSQTYSYNTTTGTIEKLIDSAAGTFTASYDLEGKMTSEIYPNGMCANTTYNAAGQATSLEYIKTRTCSETGAPVWFSDSVVSSIHGETLQQTSTLSKENYAYDNAGSLIEAQETPAGKGCVSRLYSYEEESNRISLTTREPGTEGKCATEGGTIERHAYDEANRLIDSGVEYEVFGNTTKLPASDAGGHEITSAYYVDNQIATQTQNEHLDTYTYDPAGRTMETVSENEKTKTKTTVITHYPGPDGTLSWTSEGPEKWTRNIVGIEGSLAATQEAGKSPVLQLHDLEGNIVGAAEDNEAATKLLSTYNSTEFGVPQPGTTPPKYAWLGADDVSSEPSQAAGESTESGSAYVPEIGRVLQTGPIASPGSFPNGTGGVGVVRAPYLGAAVNEFTEVAAREQAASEEAKRIEAEEKAEMEECPATECHVDGPGEGNCEVNCLTVIGGGGEETTVLGIEFGVPIATTARIPGPRGYFNVSFTINASTASSLARAFELVAGGEKPSTVAGVKGLPSALYQAILASFEGHLVGDLLGAARNLRTASIEAEGPILIVAHGYIFGYWNFEVTFEKPSPDDDDD